MSTEHYDVTHTEYAERVRERVLRDARSAREYAARAFSEGVSDRSLRFAEWAEGRAIELIDEAEALAERFHQMDREAGTGDPGAAARAYACWREQMDRLYAVSSYETVPDCPLSRALLPEIGR